MYFDSTDPEHKRTVDGVLVWSEEEDDTKLETKRTRDKRLAKVARGESDQFKLVEPADLPGFYVKDGEEMKHPLPEALQAKLKEQEEEKEESKGWEQAYAAVAHAGGVPQGVIDSIVLKGVEQEMEEEAAASAQEQTSAQGSASGESFNEEEVEDSKPPAKKQKN